MAECRQQAASRHITAGIVSGIDTVIFVRQKCYAGQWDPTAVAYRCRKNGTVLLRYRPAPQGRVTHQPPATEDETIAAARSLEARDGLRVAVGSMTVFSLREG
jgi:hypothetical protein